MINNLINIPTWLHLRINYIIRRRDHYAILCSKRLWISPKVWKHVTCATPGGEEPVRRVLWKPAMGQLRQSAHGPQSHCNCTEGDASGFFSLPTDVFTSTILMNEAEAQNVFLKVIERMNASTLQVYNEEESPQTLLTTTNRVIPACFPITVSIRHERNDDTIAGIGRTLVMCNWQVSLPLKIVLNITELQGWPLNMTMISLTSWIKTHFSRHCSPQSRFE